MILANRKALDEETVWTRAEYKVRIRLYSLMHRIVQAQVFNTIIYKILLIIEFFQFLWYAIHPNFTFLWNVNVVTWLRDFLMYFQFDGFLTDGGSSAKNLFLIALYFIFGIQVVIVIIIASQLYIANSKKHMSTIMTYSLKALSGYALLINTVLTLPFYYIFLTAFICRDGDPLHGGLTCYQGTYFIHFTAALLGIIILFITSMISSLLCIDLNPWSPTPFAAPRSRISLLKLLAKICVPIYFIVDYNGDATKEFVIIYVLFWLLMLLLRYRQTPFYNNSVFNLTLVLEVILCWASVSAFVHAFIDTDSVDNLGFLFLWLGAPFVAFTYATVVNKRRKIYRMSVMKQLKKDIEVEMYVINIISLIEDRRNIRRSMALEGLLKYHMKSCPRRETDCVCITLATDFAKDQESPEKTWYLWVKSILLTSLEKFPKSARLHTLYAYVQQEKLQNKYKALFEIMIADENKPTIEEEFCLHRYKNMIEEEMMDCDMRIAESRGVNVNVIVDFENKFVDFQNVLGVAVELHLDFWRELLENNPEIQKLQSLGSMITRSVEQTAVSFEALSTINPNQVKMLRTYGNFLKDIVNDDVEGQKILDKADYHDRSAAVNRQFLDNERLKYGENSSTCIITVSGGLKSMGIITNTNNEVSRIFGYTKADLIGQNIYRIMPRFLSEVHDSFMFNYFESSDAKVIAIERVVFPLDRSGYIIPCSLMAKVLPNLEDGLKLVGFIKELEKEEMNANREQEIEVEEEESHFLMYDGNTGVILGITHSCRTEFGIPVSLIDSTNTGSNEFTIEHVFPDLSQNNLEELKTLGSLITTINTLALAQDFLIEKEGSENSEYEEKEEKESRFKKAKVRVSLFQDNIYGDVNCKVLKFIEVKEEFDLDHFPEQNAGANNEKNEAERKSQRNAVKLQNAEDKSGIEDVNRSHQDQNVSQSDSNINAEMNDEIRDLKEFKAMISEKTVPKSIRLLRTMAFFIVLILLALICLGLGFHSTMLSDFQSGTTTVSDSYSRHDTMAAINYNLRKIQLLSSGIIQTSSSAATAALASSLSAQETALIAQLRTLVLSISDDQQTLSNMGLASIETTTVTIQTLLQNGVKNDVNYFSDAMSQYISHATSASSAPLTSFTTNNPTDSTPADFYYVRRNGLGPLRMQSESNADAFTQFYIDRTSTYNVRYQIIMIVAIAVIVISELILIPIVFSVHKTATKVLSLFGYIPITEISELANKCEQYVDNYLENHRDKQKLGFEDDEFSDRPSRSPGAEDKSYVEVQQGIDNGERAVTNQDEVEINASYLVENSLEDSMRKVHGIRVPETQGVKQVVSQMTSPTQNIKLTEMGLIDESVKPFNKDVNSSLPNDISSNMSPEARRYGKEDDRRLQVQENEEDFDVINDRAQKLLNSKDNNRAKLICQFCFMGLIFVAYFVMNYIVDRDDLDNVNNSFQHLKLISQDIVNVRYLNAFTTEYIAQVDATTVYTYPGYAYTDYRAAYLQKSITNTQNLKNSISGSFPKQFNDYVTLYNLYDGGDICANYYSSDSTALANCQNIAGGLLAQGLTLAVTRITQISADLIKTFDATSKTTSDQQAMINGDKFSQTESLLNTIAPVVQTLRDKFGDCFHNYLTYSWTIERVRFGIFIGLAIFIFVFIWLPYLANLREKIFRTKGMLNMIPMDLITKNANLRTLFANSGDILQAVK